MAKIRIVGAASVRTTITIIYHNHRIDIIPLLSLPPILSITMDAYIQFLRNALCTVKNFNYLSNTFLYDATITAQYYTFPSPLDQTTPLELLIGITQFYAFITVSIAGYRMITQYGVNKLQLITRLVNSTAAAAAVDEKKETKKKERQPDPMTPLSRQLVTKSLFSESEAATRSIFVGTNVLLVGLAFFWLFANSFHVTSTDWIGGVAGLFHSLTVMELGLIVFLYYMVVDARKDIRKSYQMQEFATKGAASKGKLSPEDVKKISTEQYSWLVGGWAPFWAEGRVSDSMVDEGTLLAKEVENVAANLTALSKMMDQEMITARILTQSRIAYFEGYRGYIYLILNFLAFYGYLVCILVYYYQEESSQPEYIRAMLFWKTNADADWLGNAVGDFMWTVEPIIILGSPMIINSMSSKTKAKKEKQL